jgi:hypothetical protein
MFEQNMCVVLKAFVKRELFTITKQIILVAQLKMKKC